ncbi:glycosyltransferase family 4 protein [Methylococcaceae bacterium WWC4]|nr:glycosyltransferase family 4 protein [Methylococcaceae bacterium WWC4]
MIRVLHITPHLGGGVGKALSGLARQAAGENAGVSHRFICLEALEKTQFVEAITSLGDPNFAVEVCPSPDRLRVAMAEADIVQFEFWNHPLLPKYLCEAELPPHRALFWCHISGLGNPRIPAGLAAIADRWVFTSACSLDNPVFADLSDAERQSLGVVSSAGLADLPPLPQRLGRPPRLGYVGTLNFAKLHPRFVEFLAAVPLADLRVKLLGDIANRAQLQARCIAAGRPELLEFAGYSEDIVAELAELDILVYLLNPLHYGTAENALIEAMAMGVVPIVLDNPAERRIVTHGQTGLVVNGPADFAEALSDLINQPERRRALAQQAAEFARTRYTFAEMTAGLNTHYLDLMNAEKRQPAYAAVFGNRPCDWFKAFQNPNGPYADDGSIPAGADLAHGDFERSKGSVFHFLKYFPDNPRLRSWSRALAEPLRSAPRNARQTLA